MDEKNPEEMTDMEKLYAGLEYNYYNPDIIALRAGAREGLDEYNATPMHEKERRAEIEKKIFGEVGEGAYIVSPLYFMSGKNIHIGNNVFINEDVSFLDVREVEIGDYCMIAPGCVITTATHPLSPQARRDHHCIAKPIKLGNDVWLGANVTIMPGVTIGDNVVVGAGAVVTKDIPANSVAVGVPAKVVSSIENDLRDDQ